MNNLSHTVRKFNPDLLGTQETLKFQADYLERQLRDYTYFGRSRMKTPNEHCGIFFRTDRFTQLAGGHFSAVSIGIPLDYTAELDLQAPRQTEPVFLFQQKTDPTLAGLTVDANDLLIGATEVRGIDGEIGN